MSFDQDPGESVTMSAADLAQLVNQRDELQAELDRLKAGLSPAVLSIIAERCRQVQMLGWTPAHDDEHDAGELAGAASAYAAHASDALHPFSQGDAFRDGTVPDGWCWGTEWWKPGKPMRNLEKAGALIVAEMERMVRQGGAA